MPLVDVRVNVSRFGTDSYVIAAAGELDMYTVTPLREKLEDVLDRGGRNVLVDLTGVSFLESTTIGVLLEAAGRLRSTSGHLVLVADDPRVLRVFGIAGLERVLRVESSLPEGVQKLVDGRTNGHRR
jgi:anti-sigma B factor antagonist